MEGIPAFFFNRFKKTCGSLICSQTLGRKVARRSPSSRISPSMPIRRDSRSAASDSTCTDSGGLSSAIDVSRDSSSPSTTGENLLSRNAALNAASTTAIIVGCLASRVPIQPRNSLFIRNVTKLARRCCSTHS